MSDAGRPDGPIAAVILALALLVAGCSDDGEARQEAKPERPAGEELATSLGCRETDEDEALSGFQKSFICRDDDRRVTQVHTFDRRNRGSVERRFTTTTVAGQVLPERGTCPDGSPERRRWFVLGDDWFVITEEDGLKEELVERHDGEVLESFAPPVTTGVSNCD